MRTNKSLSPPRQPVADVIEGTAMSASFLCLVHCLALPVLLLLLPGTLATFAQSDSVHYWAFALITPSAVAAFWLGYRRHASLRPALFGAAGLACLAVAILPDVPQRFAIALTVCGSLMLVSGHLINWRERTLAAGLE